jgi:hypothetical protein
VNKLIKKEIKNIVEEPSILEEVCVDSDCKAPIIFEIGIPTNSTDAQLIISTGGFVIETFLDLNEIKKLIKFWNKVQNKIENQEK